MLWRNAAASWLSAESKKKLRRQAATRRRRRKAAHRGKRASAQSSASNGVVSAYAAGLGGSKLLWRGVAGLLMRDLQI